MRHIYLSKFKWFLHIEFIPESLSQVSCNLLPQTCRFDKQFDTCGPTYVPINFHTFLSIFHPSKQSSMAHHSLLSLALLSFFFLASISNTNAGTITVYWAKMGTSAAWLIPAPRAIMELSILLSWLFLAITRLRS